MTPQEEADLLMIKFSKWSREEYYMTLRKAAKECALIHIDGMLDSAKYMNDNVREGYVEHWSQVKKVITDVIT